jgi:hypothetical protein
MEIGYELKFLHLGLAIGGAGLYQHEYRVRKHALAFRALLQVRAGFCISMVSGVTLGFCI